MFKSVKKEKVVYFINMELEAKLYAIHDDSLIEVANNFLIA